MVKSKKVGVSVSTICNGFLPVKWHLHMQNFGKKLPGGIHWEYNFVVADFKKNPEKNYATSRTEAVEKALARGYKWIMFVDSDVFIPNDGMTRLLSHEKDIITGVYWMKTNPPQPVVYKEMGDGPIWNIEPQDELIEIGGAGLGCTLVKLEVFEKFKEAGIKFFDQDWVYENPESKKRVHVSIGEDHWFFHQARKLGYKVWCDTNILCDHYDATNDIMYPNQEFIRKMMAKKLKSNGYGEIVDHQNMVRNIEHDKPTVVFFNASNVKFNGDSIKDKPISGSETALISMAKEMKKLDWNVHVYCNCDKEGYYDNVGYYNFDKINSGMQTIMNETQKKIDVFISSRDIRPFVDGRPPVGKTILWMHDMPFCQGFEDLEKALLNIDYVFFVSNYQAREWCKKYNIPQEKIHITRNGIDESRFENKEGIVKRKGMCVYTTTPFRGLDVLLEVWPEIKKQVPYAELHVYSNMSIYNQHNTKEIDEMLEKAKGMEGLFLRNPVTQKELAYVLLEADVMLYPNHYPETFCITAIESIKAKTPVITSNFGAIPEVLKPQECLLTDGDAHSEEYKRKFIQGAVDVLQGHVTFNFDEERDFSWSGVAKMWDLNLRTKKFKVPATKEGKPNVNIEEYWNYRHEKWLVNKTGPAKQKERYEFLSRLIPKDAYVLDIGCGCGEFLKYLYDNQIGVSWSGAEISSYAIDKAKELIPQADFTKVPDINPRELPHRNMGVITVIHTIEHLEEPEKYIEKWKKSLKEGGEMILIIPLQDNEYHEHLKIWNYSDIDDLIEKIKPKDYELKSRDQQWFYPDGRKARECVIRLWW